MSELREMRQPSASAPRGMRLLVNLVFGAFLSLALTMVLVLGVLLWGLSQEQLVRDAFGGEYCEELWALVEEQARAYAAASGIEEGLVAAAFSPGDVRRDVAGYVGAQLAGERYACDTDPALDDLRARLIAALRADGSLTEEQMSLVAEACAQDLRALYEAAVCTRGIASVAKARVELRRPLAAALALACGCVALLGLAVLRLRRGTKGRLRALSAGIGGAGLSCAVVPTWLVRAGWCEQLSLGPAHLSHALARIARQLLGACGTAGVACLLVAGLLAVATCRAYPCDGTLKWKSC